MRVLAQDRIAAARALLRLVALLAALALGLGALAAAGAGWAWSRGGVAGAGVLAVAAALLLAGGGWAALRLTAVAGLGSCGVWQAHHAACAVRVGIAALVAGAALAAVGIALG